MENKKILIVEDDEFLSKMYAAKLDLEGFQVTEAATGLQGLKAVEKDKPDLILLDLNLPEMDGFEVLKRIKEAENTRDIPVLVLTNYAQKDNIDKCLNLGASDYLIKAHFVPSEVIAKIKTILNTQ